MLGTTTGNIEAEKSRCVDPRLAASNPRLRSDDALLGKNGIGKSCVSRRGALARQIAINGVVAIYHGSTVADKTGVISGRCESTSEFDNSSSEPLLPVILW